MAEEKNATNKLIEESGMITHVKTLSILRKNGWSVLVSPYYYDSISDSIRECDLIAEKQFELKDPFNSSVQVNIRLFVECKYIKQEVVFWFDKIDREKAISNFEKETGLTLAIRYSGDILPEKVHYLSQDLVAKLFSTNSNREDVVYKAMNQCLHSQINYRRTGMKPIFNEFIKNPGASSHIVQYPVIVCENFENLIRVNFDEDSKITTEKLANHFVLETNYGEDYFLIDIVDLNYLEIFLGDFKTEAKELINSYAFRQCVSSGNKQ